MSNISPSALSLAGLALEYCRAVSACRDSEPRAFVREMLRYLPRIYVTVMDLRPYGEGTDPDDEADETGAIYETVTEDLYNSVREDISAVLGENDMYLDTPVEEMRFSDTPVAVSLSEQLADIYQQLADFAATVAQSSPDLMPDILSDLKYRFGEFLAVTVCGALRAANYIYFNANLSDE